MDETRDWYTERHSPQVILEVEGPKLKCCSHYHHCRAPREKIGSRSALSLSHTHTHTPALDDELGGSSLGQSGLVFC